MTYCWKCDVCGWTTQTDSLPLSWEKYQVGPDCDPCWDSFPCHGTSMDRDWRAEAVNVSVVGLNE